MNERKVIDAYNEALERGSSTSRASGRGYAELSFEVEPFLMDFYRPWSEEKTAPGYMYNTTTGPAGFEGGAARGS